MIRTCSNKIANLHITEETIIYIGGVLNFDRKAKRLSKYTKKKRRRDIKCFGRLASFTTSPPRYIKPHLESIQIPGN